MEKQNRAERRKNKFGGGRASEHGGWPTHLPNPVFGAESTDAASGEPKPDGAAATETPKKAPAKKAPAKNAGRTPADDDEASKSAKA